MLSLHRKFSEIYTVQVNKVIHEQRRPYLHSAILLDAKVMTLVGDIEVDRISNEHYESSWFQLHYCSKRKDSFIPTSSKMMQDINILMQISIQKGCKQKISTIPYNNKENDGRDE